MPRKKEKKGKKEEPAAPAEPKRITPVDIQQREFRVAMRGYHEQDVDQFLDDVTEEVARLYAENKRLREELEFVGTRRLDVAGAQEAETILRRARDEADRLLAEARARAAAAEAARSDPSGAAPPHQAAANLGPFVAREREFLQGLADLIQSHAEAVKEQIRRARQAGQHAPGTAAAHAESSRAAEDSTQAWTMGAEVQAPEPSKAAAAGTGSPADPGGPSSQDRAEPEIAGQDWTQYYAGPTLATRAPGSFAAAHRDDEIVDLTRAPGEDEDDSEDRSLRELFWGED